MEMEYIKCENCRHKNQPDGGWCYMWKEKPDIHCHYFRVTKIIKGEKQNEKDN